MHPRKSMGSHCAFHIALCSFFSHRVAFIMEMLADAYAQGKLHASVFQVYAQRNERITLSLYLLRQLTDFILVQQQPLRAQRIGIEIAAMIILPCPSVRCRTRMSLR